MKKTICLLFFAITTTNANYIYQSPIEQLNGGNLPNNSIIFKELSDNNQTDYSCIAYLGRDSVNGTCSNDVFSGILGRTSINGSCSGNTYNVINGRNNYTGTCGVESSSVVFSETNGSFGATISSSLITNQIGPNRISSNVIEYILTTTNKLSVNNITITDGAAGAEFEDSSIVLQNCIGSNSPYTCTISVQATENGTACIAGTGIGDCIDIIGVEPIINFNGKYEIIE